MLIFKCFQLIPRASKHTCTVLFFFTITKQILAIALVQKRNSLLCKSCWRVFGVLVFVAEPTLETLTCTFVIFACTNLSRRWTQLLWFLYFNKYLWIRRRIPFIPIDVIDASRYGKDIVSKLLSWIEMLNWRNTTEKLENMILERLN